MYFLLGLITRCIKIRTFIIIILYARVLLNLILLLIRAKCSTNVLIINYFQISITNLRGRSKQNDDKSSPCSYNNNIMIIMLFDNGNKNTKTITTKVGSFESLNVIKRSTFAMESRVSLYRVVGRHNIMHYRIVIITKYRRRYTPKRNRLVVVGVINRHGEGRG